jgi:hypothetical protein
MPPPSEFDLRAALREGEGDGPDVEQLISAGQARRAQRRTRVLSAAVIIAVAGGLGVSAAALSGGGGSAGPSAAGGAAALHGLPVPSAKGADAVTCPQAAPQLPNSHRNSVTGSTAAPAQLVQGQVSSVVVCAYGANFTVADHAASRPVRLTLAGRQATRLADSLERAPTAAPSASCASAPIERYAVIPVNPSGSPLPPLTAQVSGSSCGAVVSNGTAVRYGWEPPPAVVQKLKQLAPAQPTESPAAASTATAAPTPAPSPTPTG